MGILDEKTLYHVFSNVEVLINCNKEMLDQLAKPIQTTTAGDELKIGDIFTTLVRKIFSFYFFQYYSFFYLFF